MVVIALLPKQALQAQTGKLGGTGKQVHDCNREDDDRWDCYNGKAQGHHGAELFVESQGCTYVG